MATLADHAKELTGAQFEAHPVHRMDGAVLGVELRDETLHVQYHLASNHRTLLPARSVGVAAP